MTLDLAASLRRRKPEKRIAPLRRRSPTDLLSVYDIDPAIGIAVVPDTNVYILEAAGRLPAEASALLDRGIQFHCSVCLSELAVGLANMNPTGRMQRKVRDHYLDLFSSIRNTRLITPDESLWVDAGLIAGTLARTQGFQPHQRKQCLNDALIFLTAARIGIPVLTCDRTDFDLIQQLAPEGDVLYF